MNKLKSLSAFFIAFSLILVMICPLYAVAEEVEETEPVQVAISFNSMGGSECETIYGYAGETAITKDTLPIPTKDGYTFIEWRHFNEYGAPFELEVFPNYDIELVAYFEPIGFNVTFEESIHEVYDINSGIMLYEPDTKGYKQSVVKDGWRCLKTKSSINKPMFLLSYTGELEVGMEYELSMWLKTENSSAKGKIDFLYTENPDVRAQVIGFTEAFSLNDMKKGEWQEYRVKFVAAAPYIIVRTPNVNNLYIDEITVRDTGASGNIPELKTLIKINLIPVIIVAVLLVVCATIFILKKRKFK
ncbi:MAG: InlB B-repeat-containing protein [Clostridia bacterium]|nr:InlB B-repeat-containing protein [Clostridia bacterium]